MTLRVQAAPESHYGWIAAKADLALSPGFRALEALDHEGAIVGMVGYDGWTKSAVSMHVALDHPMALRRLIRPAFGIAFYEFGKEVVVANVLSTNERSLRLVQKLGFREVYRGKDWIDRGVDLVLHEMRRRECRWLGEKN